MVIEIIIEEFIEVEKSHVPVYQFNSKITTLPLTEIISQNDIFDYKAKYQGQSIEETPAKIPQIIKNNITNISKKLYVDLNLRGIVRVDFIVKKHTPYIVK